MGYWNGEISKLPIEEQNLLLSQALVDMAETSYRILLGLTVRNYDEKLAYVEALTDIKIKRPEINEIVMNIED